MASADISPLEGSGNSDSLQTFVYVMTAGSEAVKVGLARDPQQRRRDLQTANYQRLEIFHSTECGHNAAAIERMAHAILQEKRRSGEWFSVTPEEAKAAVERAVDAVRHGVVLPEVERLQARRKSPKRVVEEEFHPPQSKDLPTQNDMAFLKVLLAIAQYNGALKEEHPHQCFSVDGINLRIREAGIGSELPTFAEFGDAVGRILRFWINYSSLPGANAYRKTGLYPQTKIISSAFLDWQEQSFSYSIGWPAAQLMKEHGDIAFFEFMAERVVEAQSATDLPKMDVAS